MLRAVQQRRWKLRSFYTSGRLQQYFRNSENVEVLTLDSFIARAKETI